MLRRSLEGGLLRWLVPLFLVAFIFYPVFISIGCGDEEETTSYPETDLIGKVKPYVSGGIYYLHDEERQVGIWICLRGVGPAIHVLPDSEYLEVE